MEMETTEVGSANDDDCSLDQEMETEKCQCGGCKQCEIVTVEDIINHTFPTSEVAYDMFVRYAKWLLLKAKVLL
ncbi:hypothetical protein HN873_070618 [Arachis hypogaea]